MLRALTLLLLLVPSAVHAQAQVVLPPVAATAQDSPLELATAHFNAISIAGLAGETVTLEATEGTVTPASLAGLSLSAGTGTADPLVSFTGSEPDVAAALDGLVFTPDPGFAGRASLQVSVGGTTATLPIAVNAAVNATELRDTVLDGVSVIHSGVQPGRLVAFGPEAYAVVNYDGGPAEGPMIGAASWGAGRVIAAPDHQMLNMDSYGGDSGPFYKNGIEWLADSASLDVSIVTYSQGVADWLVGEGYTDVVVSSEGSLAADLPGADVLIPPWLGTSESQANRDLIADFVTSGGGLFLADYGVGYIWWWPGEPSEAPGNVLLREAGLGFATGHRWDTGTLDATNRASGQVNADALLDILLNGSGGWSAQELDEAAALLSRIYSALPADDPLALELDAAFLTAVSSITPTPATPVADAFDQAMLLRELDLLEALPVAEVVEHRSADGCFGDVPASAPRVTRTIAIDPARVRWHGTGLFAAPGDLLTVEVPASVRDLGYRVRISGHVDDISGRGSWLRMPRVARSFPLDAATVQIASPFGGALYIDIGAEPDPAPFEVVIAGAVEAPRYVHGVTTNAEWATIRELPGPQAELESEHCAISLPSRMILEVDDIEAVMAHWDRVVELQDEVAGHGDLRRMAERINVDVQISVGLLHAGYPTQGPDSASAAIPDIDTLMQTGSWGWYHELGHEAQRRPDKSWGWNNPYTFDGAVEATVNIFTSYAYDRLGQPSRGGWSWTGSRQDVMRRALDALIDGDFASLGVGEKLAMFLQLRDGWGWESWTDVFGEYNAAATQPADEQAERDLFLTRWSEAVGHDLSLFLVDTWGLAASPEAVAAVSALPDWLPALGGIEGRFLTTPGRPVDFDLQGEALSHDGTAILAVGEAEEGELRDNGDGTWTYLPEDGWEGVDSFTYTVTSSTGHTASHEVEIEVSWAGVRVERFFGIDGNAVADLTSAPAFPDAPDETEQAAAFEGPVNYAERYGTRLRAWVRVPEDGGYHFFIASDDNSELWLAESGEPEDKELVAQVAGWTGHQDWDATEAQDSGLIALSAGQVIYLEALHKEGGGGDHVSVAWEGPGLARRVLAVPYVAMSPDGFPEPPGDDDDSAGDDDDDDDDDSVGDDDDDDSAGLTGDSDCSCEASLGGRPAAAWLLLLPAAALLRRRRSTLRG